MAATMDQRRGMLGDLHRRLQMASYDELLAIDRTLIALERAREDEAADAIAEWGDDQRLTVISHASRRLARTDRAPSPDYAEFDIGGEG